MAESDHNNTGMDDERDEKLGFVTITPPNAQADRIRKMSCNDLKSWICTLNLTGVDACAIAHMLSLELVDGETFLQMTWEDMAEIGIPFHTCHELDLAKAVTLSARQSEIYIAPSSEKACLQNLEEHDRSCVYGCLLTLGYKSYRVSKGVMCTPVGPANDMFTLDCQKSSVAHSTSLEDIFQIGRCDDGCNDWVLRGVLQDDPSNPSGPGSVSRYMCRISCEKSYPFRCRIFASGYDSNSKTRHTAHTMSHEGVVIPQLAPQWIDSDGQRDAFTTHGVRVWSPSIGKWAEVSVRGRMFLPTRPVSIPLSTATNSATATVSGFGSGRRSSPLAGVSNELENGSIIDLGGVLVLFQTPLHRSSTLLSPPFGRDASPTDLSERIIKSMNLLRPQCPVLMHTIYFPSSPPHKKKSRHMWEQRRGCFDRPVRCRNPSVTRAVNRGKVVMQTDGVELSRIPYVFAACGHVHGYSRELEGRPCPLCRMTGPYVPLLPACEPMICNKWPTHVFNPCGHAASLEMCQQWVDTPLPDVCSRKYSESSLSPCCPFCLIKLEMSQARGGPYSRLLIQFEQEDSVDDMMTDIETYTTTDSSRESSADDASLCSIRGNSVEDIHDLKINSTDVVE